MKSLLLVALFLIPVPLAAMDTVPGAQDMALISEADVVIVGETHDNPAHHAVQAQIVAALAAPALVVEMLTQDEATDLAADPQSYAAAWEDAGWPDYEMYRPIFTASDARIFGAAVPREVARATYTDGVAAHFDGDLAAFGLDHPLPDDEQALRLDLQFAAHCEAMPRDMMGGMIEVQRLRDATLAKVTLGAIDATGGPVVIITGNGHARSDWGVPAYLRRLRPDLKVVTIGQAEDGLAPEGGFDLLYDAPSVERPDPCASLK